MSDYRITSNSNRILPGDMDGELHRLPWRLTGMALIGLSVIGWLSLLTWSIGDPSFNRATNGLARNLLGTTGASLADMLLQMFGLVSITLFLPLAIWGHLMSRGDVITNTRHRLIMWALSMFLLSSTLAMFSKPDTWFLEHGLGGVVGDIGQNIFMHIGGFMEPTLAKIIGGVISGFFGVWTLTRASALTYTDIKLLWHIPERKADKKNEPEKKGWLSRAGGFFAQRAGDIRQKIISQAQGQEKGSSPRSPNPREYWLAEDPDRFSPPPRRQSEGSFDARLGYDMDDELEPLPRVHRVPPRNEPSKSRLVIQHEDGRIEPYFGGENTPVSDPTVTVVPYSSQQRTQPQPARQAAPARQRVPEPEPEPVRAPPPSYGDPLASADDDDDDDFDGPPFEMPRNEPPRPEPRREPLKPQIRRTEPQQPSRSRGLFGRSKAQPEPEEKEFLLPPMKLLSPPPARHNNPELSDVALGRRAEMLQGVLEDFGIKGMITGVHPGPVITLYELEPARGTKSSRVIGLADDIARSMSAVSCRVAVIPGRDAIGIELPNQNREIVYLRELLDAPDFNSGKAKLALALGKTIGGEPITVDLTRMPHLLIAGTTGSGKSVAINTMILSLLYRLKPEDCRFIMIDPKMLELSVYDGIPHLLTPVVTDPKKAIVALKWTVSEMTSRYERMCKLGVRNIQGFNQKVTRAKAQGRPLGRTVQTGFDEDTGSAIYEHEDVDCSPMPYIVVVIDEMADLMMVAGKEIEFTVQRLSQMARAAGIHLIMATQRPSVDVITGTIKANFPSRLSFQVASKIDSRTILGEQGAEQLLGAGDMLTMAAGGRIMRAHGPFVSDDEVENVVTYLRAQGEPNYLDGVLDEDGDSPRSGGNCDIPRSQTGDDLYDQAVDVVLRERRATTSYLQRRLGVGYNRAASLIEQMEKDGLISAPNRTGKRDIIVGEES